MSPIPSFLGNNRRSNNIFDPFSLEIWDPFKDLSFPSSLTRESSSGMKKEEIKVEIEDDTVLKISAQRHMEKEEKKDDTWHRLEISSGRFTRKFKLPENVKMEQVKASMENGVLTVIVPKVETKKLQVKSNKISA